MRILIVKLSSLGDLIHTFPALTDAAAALPQARFDWIVDHSFREVPPWHPAVAQTHTLPLRQWRKHRQFAKIVRSARTLRGLTYDLIIDAQGLVKSALVARLVNGPTAGYDQQSIREPLASRSYQARYAVSRDWHAIRRIRSLFAQTLGYPIPDTSPDYGLTARKAAVASDHILLLHGASWSNKLWPTAYWVELIRLIGSDAQVLLPGHTPEEQARAHQIVQQAGRGQVLPALGLDALYQQIAACRAVVGLDSGLAHLAAALHIPAVTLYGPTQVSLSGAIGPYQHNLHSDFACAPCLRRTCDYTGPATVQPACFAELTPARVWQQLQHNIASSAA
ncbi:MAG: lipopolysaccharide heptosyltransferase I [Pseudomonadota bacterium]